MRTVDTSVVVAAFASWHEQHERARRALDEGVHLVDHCALEAYSVLTRLPAPHRAPASIVATFLRERFPKPFLRLTASQHRAFVLQMATHGITGGSAYDALVAATSAAAKATLVTCDRRATAVYEKYGVRFQLLE